MTTPEKAAALGLRPLARLVTWGVAGVEPERMGIGPVSAVQLALRRAAMQYGLAPSSGLPRAMRLALPADQGSAPASIA